MRPSFYPRLVNGPFDDPGLFIQFLLEKRAVLFDLGDIYALSARDVLKTSHVFVTHTHMDHFVGFDRLLRLLLGREQQLFLYGPEGFGKNVEGRLSGYTWNLIDNYNNRLGLHVTDVHPEHLVTKHYFCEDRFLPARQTSRCAFDGILHQEPALAVSAQLLDHGIGCLGFTIKERFHINIMKDRVADLGLEVGPWLNKFKQALFAKSDPESEFEVIFGRNNTNKKKFVLAELANKIALITPGQKVSYIADVGFSQSNCDKIVELVRDSDQLFIEAAFLEKDKDIAERKYHLTASQAGHIAGKAQVKQFTLFHFSPRYKGLEHLFQEEARMAFEKAR